MIKDIKLLFVIFRNLIMLVTFILAVILENAGDNRLAVMIVLFLLFFIWLNVRELIYPHLSRYLIYTFAFDLIVLMALDNSSKYVVNYYFNIYYFYVLIEACYMLEKKKRLFASLAVTIAAFVKYYRLVETALMDEKPVYNLPFVLSYMFFTLMVFGTIAVFFNYSRVLSEEKSRLDKLNRELSLANEMLEEKNEKIKELTIYEERNRIARDIHDSVGHGLTGLIMNLDFCTKIADAEPEGVKSRVAACGDIARECLSEIRRSVQALKPASVEQLPLVKSLEELIESAGKKFNISIELSIEGKIYETRPDFNLVVYRAVQEAVTNSVKHGNADEVVITLTFGESEISIFIKDNGKGIKQLKLGNGLTGMVERVKYLGGEVSFYKNDGFMINIKIPAGDKGII